MVKIKLNGSYNITYNKVEYSFKGGNEYDVDEKTSKMLIENNYGVISTIKRKNDKTKGK